MSLPQAVDWLNILFARRKQRKTLRVQLIRNETTRVRDTSLLNGI